MSVGAPAVELVRGVVLGRNVPLGPFATPAVALRWIVVERRVRALVSGWLGDDPLVACDDGRRVRVALRGAELVTDPKRTLGPLYLEPGTPDWIRDLLERKYWRFFRLDATTWTERVLVAGDRVELSGERLVPLGSDYRAAAGDADAVLEGARARVVALAEARQASRRADAGV